MRERFTTSSIAFIFAIAALTACNGGGDTGPSGPLASTPQSPAATDPASSQPAVPAESASSESTPSQPRARTWKTDALLFTGAGTWGTEVASLEDILKEHGTSYDAVGSSELDAMSAEQLASYGMIIWPGGSGGTEAQSISAGTRVRIRKAVQEAGVSWLGFCAGAFVAVAPTPADGGAPSYGLGIVNGPELDYYSREAWYQANGGTDIEMATATFADGRKRDLLWYGGPVTPETPGGVVARYSDGTAMISQIQSGKGFVVLSATHPTAPQSVRDEFGLKDPDGLDFDIVWELIQSALNAAPMPSFK